MSLITKAPPEGVSFNTPYGLWGEAVKGVWGGGAGGQISVAPLGVLHLNSTSGRLPQHGCFGLFFEASCGVVLLPLRRETGRPDAADARRLGCTYGRCWSSIMLSCAPAAATSHPPWPA